MAKMKSHTVTREFDEQGHLISHWESTEYHSEPEDTGSFYDGSETQIFDTGGFVRSDPCPAQLAGCYCQTKSLRS